MGGCLSRPPAQAAAARHEPETVVCAPDCHTDDDVQDLDLDATPHIHAPDCAAMDERLRTLAAVGCEEGAPSLQELDTLLLSLCKILRVSTAMVSFIFRDRCWVRNRVDTGKDMSSISPMNHPIPWKIALCPWTLSTPHPQALVLTDMASDARSVLLSYDMSLAGCYVSYPLVASDGNRLGAICLLDDRYKRVDAGACRVLANFGELAVRVLERQVALGHKLQSVGLAMPPKLQSVCSAAASGGTKLPNKSGTGAADLGSRLMAAHLDLSSRIPELAHDQVQGGWVPGPPPGICPVPVTCVVTTTSTTPDDQSFADPVSMTGVVAGFESFSSCDSHEAALSWRAALRLSHEQERQEAQEAASTAAPTSGTRSQYTTKQSSEPDTVSAQPADQVQEGQLVAKHPVAGQSLQQQRSSEQQQQQQAAGDAGREAFPEETLVMNAYRRTVRSGHQTLWACVLLVDTSQPGWPIVYADETWQLWAGFSRAHILGQPLSSVVEPAGPGCAAPRWEMLQEEARAGKRFAFAGMRARMPDAPHLTSTGAAGADASATAGVGGRTMSGRSSSSVRSSTPNPPPSSIFSSGLVAACEAAAPSMLGERLASAGGSSAAAAPPPRTLTWALEAAASRRSQPFNLFSTTACRSTEQLLEQVAKLDGPAHHQTHRYVVPSVADSRHSSAIKPSSTCSWLQQSNSQVPITGDSASPVQGADLVSKNLGVSEALQYSSALNSSGGEESPGVSFGLSFRPAALDMLDDDTVPCTIPSTVPMTVEPSICGLYAVRLNQATAIPTPEHVLQPTAQLLHKQVGVDSLAGEVFSGLRVDHLLGCGGYGMVFYGCWLDQEVVVKVQDIKQQCQESMGAAQLEVLLGQKLCHANVVRTLAHAAILLPSPATSPRKSASERTDGKPAGSPASRQSSADQNEGATSSDVCNLDTEAAAVVGYLSQTHTRVEVTSSPPDVYLDAQATHSAVTSIQGVQDVQGVSASYRPPDSDQPLTCSAPPAVPGSAAPLVTWDAMLGQEAGAAFQVSCAVQKQGQQEAGGARDPATVPLPPDAAAERQLRLMVVQEFCNGGTLQEAIDSGKLRHGSPSPESPISVPKVLQVARDVARGLAYLHSQDIAHADLSAHNVLLHRKSRPAPSPALGLGLAGTATALLATSPASLGDPDSVTAAGGLLITDSSVLTSTDSGLDNPVALTACDPDGLHKPKKPSRSRHKQAGRQTGAGKSEARKEAGVIFNPSTGQLDLPSFGEWAPPEGATPPERYFFDDGSQLGGPRGARQAEPRAEQQEVFRYTVKLADLGKAQLCGSDPVVVNAYATVTHMAPEVLADKLVTPQADIYALGVLIWQMLTSRRPWSGKTHQEVVQLVTRQHEQLRWPPVKAIPPGVFLDQRHNRWPAQCGDAQHVEQLIALGRACVSPNRADRPSAQSALQQLEALCSMCGLKD